MNMTLLVRVNPERHEIRLFGTTGVQLDLDSMRYFFWGIPCCHTYVPVHFLVCCQTCITTSIFLILSWGLHKIWATQNAGFAFGSRLGKEFEILDCWRAYRLCFFLHVLYWFTPTFRNKMKDCWSLSFGVLTDMPACTFVLCISVDYCVHFIAFRAHISVENFF